MMIMIDHNPAQNWIGNYLWGNDNNNRNPAQNWIVVITTIG